MKKFKLIVPSFIALIFCMLLIAGSTFALFTSQAEASISVTSGKVEISATLDNLELYSADHEYTTGEEAGEIFANDELWANYAGKYYFKPQTGSFANGGTAAVTGSNLAIEKMTPGDKVELDLTVTNTSNVNIKYRVVIEASYKVGTRTYDQALAYALKTTIGNTTKTSLSAYKSNWILLTAGTSQNPAPLHLEFELPLLAGNEYQDSGVLFSFKVEAVQANAATNGVESFEVITGYSKTQQDTANANKVVAKSIVVDPTADTTENPDAGKLTVEATVTDTITPTTFKGENEADMPNVTSTQLEVSDLFLTKDEFTNETTISADVQLKDQDGNNIKSSTVPVEVTVFVGKGFNDVRVYHKGELVENSTYNSTDGTVTFTTTSFSPFTFVGDFAALIGTTYYATFDEAYAAANADNTLIMLKDVYKTSVLQIGKSVNIDGNGHSIYNTANRVIRLTTANITVNLSDLGVISQCTDTSDVRGISFDNAAANVELTLDSCKISASFYAINAIPGANNITINVIDGTIAAGWAAFNIYSNNSTIYVENSVLAGLNDKDENSWNNFNTITLDGNCLYSSNVGTAGSNNTIELIDSTVYASSESDNNQAWIGIQYGATGNSVYVENTRIIDSNGNDQTSNYGIRWYCNYDSTNKKWNTYYENDSEIFILTDAENGLGTLIKIQVNFDEDGKYESAQYDIKYNQAFIIGSGGQASEDPEEE